ncbi:MAG: hypothetical protein FJ102_18840 [Deltaproteobacteria bacterium]|nr:hypothetical protein [Deltaproteobacteria bacterium]
MLIPAVLATLVVLVLVGIWLGGGFASGGLDGDGIGKLARERGWQLEVTGQGTSRGVYTLSAPGEDWKIVLRRAERSRRGSQFAPIMTAAGGSGTAWFSSSPSSVAFVAVVPGDPLPEGESNDLLAGPAAGLVRPLFAQAMRDLAGGDVPVPERLVSFRTGDTPFDLAHRALADDPDAARRLVNAGVRQALAAPTSGPAPSLVLSGAGLQLALEGPADPSSIDRLIAAGKAARAALLPG